MQYVSSVLKSIGGIISPADEDDGMKYHLSTPNGATLQLPMTNGDVHLSITTYNEDDGLLEEDVEYVQDEESVKSFVLKYDEYMLNYYGRKAEHKTDLRCAMFPTDIFFKRLVFSLSICF